MPRVSLKYELRHVFNATSYIVPTWRCRERNDGLLESRMEVHVLGCGPSSSVPSMRCLLSSECNVCKEAYENPTSMNHRLNPSILIRVKSGNGTRNILIDCGKTFRQAALRLFPKLQIDTIDAIILTHDHADAVLGLDDLREVQPFRVEIDPITKESCNVSSGALPVFCNEETQQGIETKFPYLCQSENTSARWVAQINFSLFQPLIPFSVCGYDFVPLPVLHGDDYYAFGYVFGFEVNKCFVYISDVSHVPPQTMQYLVERKESIDFLMIDALNTERRHNTHMNLPAVINLVLELRPKQTYLTGMSHDFDYNKTNAVIRDLPKLDNLKVEMAYDGLFISL
uniref:Uncharacterized protein AlNc14C265G9881 n=1 Tax=Albugo laibachii Nc14 TaxID=890382 RepID=F0WU58_9STRA|nr:conserved hypothetical protein [Albugo laibachii Nc14]|eukprot:CCA24935.1 conserved hypothetical protein [Albugo laibachii Nc14]